jgi:excisionase family DNA binding protein
VETLLTVNEAAKTLRVSPRTICALTQEGSLACVRIGRRVLYGPADVRAFVDRCRQVGDRQADATISSKAAMMTVTEVAEYLRVGRNKILSWIATGALQAANTATRRGGRPRYRVRKSDLDIFLDGRTKVAKPNRTRRPTRHEAERT